MELNELISRFSNTTENQTKAIFSSLFIITNQLQTIFDNNIPEISLKQFMLLTMIRQSNQQLTFTNLGKLLGCSRQNIKKLAYALEKKGFVTITKNNNDVRALAILPTEKLNDYFDNIFITYQNQLHHLFAYYNETEIKQLFTLLMKLYPGIKNLENHT